MNLTNVAAHLTQLASISSSNAKIDYLRLYNQDSDLKEFFRLTLDGRHNFFISAPKSLPAAGAMVHITDDCFDCFSSRILTGNAAKDHLDSILKTLTDESQGVVCKILSRDARCGVNASTVNKVWGKLIFEYDLMKGESLNDYGTGKEYNCVWSGQKKKITRIQRRASGKLDGRRLEAERSNGTWQFLSSSGRPVNIADKAIPELDQLPIPDGFYVDGELCDTDWNSSMSVTASGNKSETWSFQVFGLWTKEERWGEVKTTHAVMEFRMASIIGQGTKHVKIAKDYGVPTTEAEADAMQEQAFKDGLEGIMWKEMEAPYLARRSQAWLKAKAEETIDVQIVEVQEGEKGKKYEGTMGALLVEDADGIRFSVGIGKDGSLTDAVRKWFWDNRATVMGIYVEVLQDKVLDKKKIAARFPRYVRLRTDK